MNVYVNVLHQMTVVLNTNMNNLSQCEMHVLCECYIIWLLFSIQTWTIFSECLCECYMFDCCFNNIFDKSSVRWMFMWMLHQMTVVFNTNMENVQWDECLCECYIIIWLLFSSIQTWKMFSEMNVYVNVTFYDCCSQNKHEQSSVRWMFMW
jgi:hypothetical protein